MGSYILFSRTSTARFDRSTWGPGLGNSADTLAPGNPGPGSSFDAETLTPAQLAAGAGLFFDVTGGANAALAALGTATPLFAAAATTLLSANDVAGDTIHLAQTDANWNGIKNLEIEIGTDSGFTRVEIENIVDTRLRIGDDPCAPVADEPTAEGFVVELLGVKRGEVDASLASGHLELRLDAWSNGTAGQNAFDVKGSVYDDVVQVGAGTVAGSAFGLVAAHDADGTYDGRFTRMFVNLGAGDDSYDALNAVGDALTGKNFRSIDKVWGGSGDDAIATGFGNDLLYGDDGSGADFYADPGSVAEYVADDFIHDAIGGGAVPGFQNGLGPLLLGTLVDMGAYTIEATGGELVQLKTGLPGTRAGGLGIRSANDPIGSLADIEVDSRDGDEAIVIDFKGGAHGVELDLTAMFVESTQDNKQPFLAPETVVYDVLLADGSTFTGYAQAIGPVTLVPGALTIAIDESDTGGELIEQVTLRPQPNDFTFQPFSDFYLSAVRACVVVAGEAGDDELLAGGGADWLEGNRGDDTLFLGVDGDRDIVNFNDGDGADVAFDFDIAKDRLRMQGNEAIGTSVVVDPIHGIGILVEHGADGDGVFLVGVVDPTAIDLITF